MVLKSEQLVFLESSQQFDISHRRKVVDSGSSSLWAEDLGLCETCQMYF